MTRRFAVPYLEDERNAQAVEVQGALVHGLPQLLQEAGAGLQPHGVQQGRGGGGRHAAVAPCPIDRAVII